MGVHGLWQLLGSTGKPVPLESLDGKVLAVDVSVWLHQLSKGMRDSHGNPLPNAHLHGLFTRICKLLYYRIKPVFVFDGGVPILKKQTLTARRDKREDAERSSSVMQQKILTNLIRSQALKEAYGLDSVPNLPSTSKSSAKGNRDGIFELPPLPEHSKTFLSQMSTEDDTYLNRLDLQQMVEDEYESMEKINVDSEDFKALPPEIQHEIITDIRLRRKNYNLSKIVELPDDSKDFSSFQMAKLVKHNRLNTRLDQLRKELNQRQTRSLTKQCGGKFHGMDDIYSQRMVSEDSSHYILAKRKFKQKKGKEEKRLKMEDNITELSEEHAQVKGFVDDIVESDDDDDDDEDELNETNWEMGPENSKQSAEGERAVLTKLSDVKINTEKGATGAFIESSSDGKARFRPVIEIESGSDSESDIVGDDDDVEFISERFRQRRNLDEAEAVDDSFENDQALQMAIEQSLKDHQSETNANQSIRIAELNMPIITSGQQTTKSTNETSEMDKPGKGMGKEQNNINKLKTVETTKGVKLLDKPVTDYKQIVTKTDVVKMKTSDKSSVFKRKMSRLSDGSNSHDRERKLVKIIESSDDESVETENKPETIESSDTDDDFIEVKVDLTKVAEDDLFPASMFEASVDNDEEEDGEDDDEEENAEDDEVISVSKLKKQRMLEPDGTEMTQVEEIPVLVLGKSEKQTPIGISTNKQTTEEFNYKYIEHSGDEDKNATINRSDVIPKNSSEKGRQFEHQESFASVTSVADDDSEKSETDDGDDYKNANEPDNEIMLQNSNIEAADDNSGDKVTSEDCSNIPDVMEGIERRSASPRGTDLVRQFESLDENHVRALSYNLAQENRQLRQEQGRQERLAVSITDQMHAEAQELLQLFGIPYIVSPTEAEAQCAFLELTKLTHGTITDDSDIWLFGGKCVFKNFFNQQKHVECFRDVHITSQLGLVRESLINLALLCGSDYTEGIRGVGPVIAMEILAEFPGQGLDGLNKLKNWWNKAQKQIQIPTNETKLRSKLRDVHLIEGFPSQVVVDAYMSPTVDESTEKFSWSLPDLDQLRKFANDKLGWDKQKTDENLLPVLKRLSEKQTQRSIQAFFQPEVYMQPPKMKSKRLQNVVSKIMNPNQKEPSATSADQSMNKAGDKNKLGSKTNVDTDKDNAEGGSEKVESKGIKRRKKSSKISEGLEADKDVYIDGRDTEDKPKHKTRVRKKKSEHDAENSKKMTQQVDEEVQNKISDIPSKEVNAGIGKGRAITRGQNKTQRYKRSGIQEQNTVLPDIQSSDTSDSESDSDFSSSSETSVEILDKTSDDEVPVIQTGLNIEEILGLKMGDGDKHEDKAAVTNNKGRNRVFESAVNVEELLKLEGGSSNGSFDNDLQNDHDENTVSSDTNGGSDDDNDTKQTSDADYSMEGGFIREDDDACDTLDTVKSHHVEARKQTLKKVTFKVEQEDNGFNNKDHTKFESDKNNKNVCGKSSSTTNAEQVTKGLTKQERNEAIDTPGPRSSDQSMSSDTNLLTKPLKTESKPSTRSTRKKTQSIYSDDPIKPVVKGVPWAERGKGRRKVQTGKGRGKNILPIETVVKRTSKPEKTKKLIDGPNLSESDSE